MPTKKQLIAELDKMRELVEELTADPEDQPGEVAEPETEGEANAKSAESDSPLVQLERRIRALEGRRAATGTLPVVERVRQASKPQAARDDIGARLDRMDDDDFATEFDRLVKQNAKTPVWAE